MGRGGIYDQVGGGFHRYSVDEEWLTPHFEKMLYNQAQLGMVYLQAYQLTGNDFFARVARQTCNYVLRDMQIDQGGYYSATDADSEERKVLFTWSQSELEKCLSPAQAELTQSLFGVSPEGILRAPISCIYPALVGVCPRIRARFLSRSGCSAEAALPGT